MTDQREYGRRAFALSAALAVACSVAVTVPAMGAEPAQSPTSGIDPAQFAAPAVDYRPGVRWWWPGNAASEEDLLAQIDYLSAQGFGAVEIVSFTAGFLTGDGTASGVVYDGASLGYDMDQILSYESPEYFAKLDAVIARANELGITVDLNIGSGYLANDDSIGIEDSQSNMSLGRATVRIDAEGSITVISGGIEVAEGAAGTARIGIPTAEVSPLYASEKHGFDFGEWSAENIHLNSVMLAPITGQGAVLDNANQTLTSDFTEVKTYGAQSILDLDSASLSYPDADATTFDVDITDLAAGDYEVVALYSAPAGVSGLHSIVENTTTGKRNYVVDHLDPESITKLVNGWLGEADLNAIVESRDVRAAFNDSYEFYTDAHYNDVVQASAASRELLGYDITPYIPSLYALYKDAFLILGTPTVKAEYAALGLQTPRVSPFGGGSLAMIVADLSEEEAQRIEYDYGRLLNEAFLAGMEAFSTTLNEYGIDYRQQAYNPPVDELKAAQYVDIPETEGLDEYSLKQVSSGAHLYGKNLVTSEVYTLGSVPFRVTPDFIKQGYDLMATSGVNNFFYHGLSATYHGNEDPAFTSDDDLFAEEGWRAWPTIGVEMADTAGISDYYATMNDYAARANYLMQSGSNSSDVAIYVPLFGSLASGGGFGGGSEPLDAITTAQTNGWAWDAINDDTIQNDLVWDGSALVANGGNASFDALIVESGTVPLETMQALQSLQAEGAPITLLGSAPATQPGYAGGDYAELDAQVARIAADMGGALDAGAVIAEVAQTVTAPISYQPNTEIRFARRTLETGGELAYIRNTSAEAATPVTLTVSEAFGGCWWLDPATGDIFAANIEDGTVTATLDAAGAVALLCEPTGAGVAPSAVSSGLPDSIDTTERSVVNALGALSLEVTADNIGTNTPGETRTVSFEGDVLGDWSTDLFEGQLRYVADAGTYRTEAVIPDASDLVEGGAVLRLGTVHSAATVRVNPGTDHEFETQLYAAPFEVDIAPALVDGRNTIEIEVQPVQSNRREGLEALYKSDPVANVQYQAYNSVAGGDGLSPAGLVGPLELRSAVESVAEVDPPVEPTPTPGTGGGGSGDNGGSSGGGSGSASGNGDDLANTGADGVLAALLALFGVVLAGAGAALAVTRRRQRLSE